MFNPYEILGVDRFADKATIKRKWKEIAQVEHPDKNPDNPYAKERFQQFKEAYEILIDPQRRALFDRGKEPKVFNPRPDALGHITGALHAQLQTTGPANIVQKVRGAIIKKLHEVKNQVRHTQKQVDNLEASLKKFGYSGDERNIIADSISDVRQRGLDEMRLMKRTIEALDLALVILGDYNDIADLQIGWVQIVGGTTSSTTG